MTEKIQHIIDGIRLKYKMLYTQLESERTAKAEREAEVNALKEENKALKIRNHELELEAGNLKSELDAAVQQRIDEKENLEKGRNEEIDDLVREIEHCINQLKQ